MTLEHPFAQYVRILGKGPHLSRALTAAETAAAVRMVMMGEVEPVQLGAFLCLLRVKTETPQEVAGFVRGIRAALSFPTIDVDLDWPTYAGKARQLPWYLLAALLLAENGVRVLMHGVEGHTPGRIYAREALQTLGIPIASSWDEVKAHLGGRGFAFLPLEKFAPRLQEILSLRSFLGVRSPVHTVARQVNPLDAPCQILSVTHPPYRPVHRDAALLLEQPCMAVFKGEGGEAERRPAKPVEIAYVRHGQGGEEYWPALLPDTVQSAQSGGDGAMEPARLGRIWRGKEEDSYATAAITGTAAIALWLLGRAENAETAQTLATTLWSERKQVTA